MEINSTLLREKLPNITLGASGPIGTAAATVDNVSHVGLTASAANLSFTLPTPTDLRSGRDFRVTNTGAISYAVLAKFIGVNEYADFSWDNGAWHSEAPTTASASDFWRTDPGSQLPDGSADVTDAIVRTGQTKIDTGTNGDSGLTLDDLRSLNSAQGQAGLGGVTDTNMMAVGVDINGKVRLSNTIASPDLRATNPNPQDYAAGVTYAFKQSAIVGLTGASFNAIPTYVELETTRRYAIGADFSGGPVVQRAFIEDGREYYRVSTGATTWGPWKLEGGSRPAMQPRFHSQATTKISLAGEIRWVGFYHVMTTGTNAAEPAGHFRIDMPADGFAVPVAGGGTRAVVPAVAGSAVDTGGIPLNAWETLWYRHPYGQGSGSIPGNFLIVPYTANTNVIGPFTNPDEWIKIAQRDDASVFTLGTGDVVSTCAQIGRGGHITAANWSAMKSRAMGDGYFFAPAGNTAVPTAFGFTGTIRWIDGGSTPNVNGAGYRDAGQPQKLVGTAIRGVNGAANKTWRLMTAAEKPAWFGGALRGNNPIVPASTTVVDLADNETLFFVPNIESGVGTEGQWVVSGYLGVVSIPAHWLPIASRQVTGSHSTVQVLVGGLQYALKAGEAKFTSTNDATIDAIRRAATIQFNGMAYCRNTTAAFFGAGPANQNLGYPNGVMVSWDDSDLMYGISDGYASFGNQYTWINVPSAGTEIPVVSAGSNATRVVQTIGAHRYIPLGTWEALYWIPPSYAGGGNSANGDFVIGFFSAANQHIPPSAVLIAKVFAAPNGSGVDKTRVRFVDGSYIQPGSNFAGATPTEYDHAQGSGDWRNATVAGSTSPGNTAAMPAVAGVGGNYAAPYTMRYKYAPNTNGPRGKIEVRGLILLNANVLANSDIAFLPGVVVDGEPILGLFAAASNANDTKMIPVQIRAFNTTVGTQSGVVFRVQSGGLNTLQNAYFTLGPNGNGAPGGNPLWISFDGVELHHA